MDLGISDKVKPILEEVKHFIDTEILPLEHEYHGEVSKGDRWTFTERQTEILESLKAKARAKNLWNFFLTHFEGGHGLNTVEYAYIAQETGRSHLAPEVFNCAAPDTGNMEVLARYCTEEQKETWLKPLLAGEIRSAYAMTEPRWPHLMPRIFPCPVLPMATNGYLTVRKSGSLVPVTRAAR